MLECITYSMTCLLDDWNQLTHLANMFLWEFEEFNTCLGVWVIRKFFREGESEKQSSRGLSSEHKGLVRA